MFKIRTAIETLRTKFSSLFIETLRRKFSSFRYPYKKYSYRQMSHAVKGRLSFQTVFFPKKCKRFGIKSLFYATVTQK